MWLQRIAENYFSAAIFDPAGKNCEKILKIKLNTIETKKNKLPLRGKPQESSVESLCFVPAHQSKGLSGATLSSRGQMDSGKKRP